MDQAAQSLSQALADCLDTQAKALGPRAKALMDLGVPKPVMMTALREWFATDLGEWIDRQDKPWRETLRGSWEEMQPTIDRFGERLEKRSSSRDFVNYTKDVIRRELSKAANRTRMEEYLQR